MYHVFRESIPKNVSQKRLGNISCFIFLAKTVCTSKTSSCISRMYSYNISCMKNLLVEMSDAFRMFMKCFHITHE